MAETAVVRRTEGTQNASFQFVGGKRGREEVPVITGGAGPLPKRGPGRPPLGISANDGTQGRITSLFAAASATPATSSVALPALQGPEPGATQATALVLSQHGPPEPMDTQMQDSADFHSTNEL